MGPLSGGPWGETCTWGETYSCNGAPCRKDIHVYRESACVCLYTPPPHKGGRSEGSIGPIRALMGPLEPFGAIDPLNLGPFGMLPDGTLLVGCYFCNRMPLEALRIGPFSRAHWAPWDHWALGGPTPSQPTHLGRNIFLVLLMGPPCFDIKRCRQKKI